MRTIAQLAKMTPEERLALVASTMTDTKLAEMKPEDRVALVAATMRKPSETFADPVDSHEASIRVWNHITALQVSGLETANGAIREYFSEDFFEITRNMQGALMDMRNLVHGEVEAAKVAPPPNEWRDPKVDWRTVGLEPAPAATNADQAFKKLCTAIAALQDLAHVSEAAPRIAFDKAAWMVGTSVVSAAAQELAQFAMPWVKFDTGAKTMTEQVSAIAAAKVELAE